MRSRLAAAILMAAACRAGAAPAPVITPEPGQQARVKVGKEWETGRLVYTWTLRGGVRRDSCLGMTLDSTAITFTVLLSRSSDVEIWLSDSSAPSHGTQQSLGRWIPVHQDRLEGRTCERE